MGSNPYFAGIFLLSALGQAASAQQACEKLKDLKLPRVEITFAGMVGEGPLSIPSGGNPNATPPVMPAHCDVKVVAKPTSDSEIGIEVWLPAAGWNGRYEQVGNGGWAGSIQGLATDMPQA